MYCSLSAAAGELRGAQAIINCFMACQKADIWPEMVHVCLKDFI